MVTIIPNEYGNAGNGMSYRPWTSTALLTSSAALWLSAIGRRSLGDELTKVRRLARASTTTRPPMGVLAPLLSQLFLQLQSTTGG